jgi:hypothetical protein
LPEKPKVIVFSEVFEVLHIECRQRQTVGKATGGDPRVVDRAGTSTELGVGLQFAPFDRYSFIEREQDNLLPPVRQAS